MPVMGLQILSQQAEAKEVEVDWLNSPAFILARGEGLIV